MTAGKISLKAAIINFLAAIVALVAFMFLFFCVFFTFGDWCSVQPIALCKSKYIGIIFALLTAIQMGCIAAGIAVGIFRGSNRWLVFAGFSVLAFLFGGFWSVLSINKLETFAWMVFITAAGMLGVYIKFRKRIKQDYLDLRA